ncbi:hypothetical protein [Streptomyces sp.]|uniref:hypothetical protein n=1 Tax=Streptomyces sp. TaxID=1931 RepID=UPI002F94ACF7
MHRRPIAAAALLLTALTACSGPGDDPKPAPTVTVTASPSLSREEAVKGCVDAVVERALAETGEVPSEPRPAGCESLTESEYLDAYMDGLSEANRRGLESRG